MEIYDHPQCNTTLNPAKGDEQSVEALPVCKGNMGVIPVVRSYWVPTDAELMLLLNGQHCIALSIVGHTHAPIRLDVVDAELGVQKVKAMTLVPPTGPGPNDPTH